MADDRRDEDESVTAAGPVRIDWPQALGDGAAGGAGVASEMIAPLRGALLARIPLVKRLKRKHAW